MTILSRENFSLPDRPRVSSKVVAEVALKECIRPRPSDAACFSTPRSACKLALASLALPLICLAAFAQKKPQIAPRTAESGRLNRTTTIPHLQISKINDPSTANPITEGSRGDAVVRAAILLDRIKFSPGEISQEYNRNLSKAVSAFQSANALAATGNLDPTSWEKLNEVQTASNAVPDASSQPSDSSTPVQAIVKYVIAFEDVSGPFSKLPRVSGRNAGEQLMLREAKMKELNYESAIELLGEKFHASPVLLRELNPGRSFDKAGVEISVPNVLTPESQKAASILVDGVSKSVSAKDAAGKVLAFYPATVGSKHDPLPAGDWKITEITRYPHFKYNPNLFWDSENKHPRATLAPGPKNPVGVVWIGISKEHYGIHGTPDPAKIGTAQSHGCIRLTNWDALELSRIVSIGIPVVIKPADQS